MAILEDLNLTEMLNDPDSIPGGGQERILMSLLAGAANKKGYQALQLPLMMFLLKDKMQGFDQARQKQAQFAQQIKALALKRSLAQARHEEAKMAREQELANLQRNLPNTINAPVRVPGYEDAALGMSVGDTTRAPTEQERQFRALEAYPTAGAGFLQSLFEKPDYHFIAPSPGQPAYAVRKDRPEQGAIVIPGTEKTPVSESDKSINMNDLLAFIQSGGRIRKSSIPPELTVAEARGMIELGREGRADTAAAAAGAAAAAAAHARRDVEQNSPLDLRATRWVHPDTLKAASPDMTPTEARDAGYAAVTSQLAQAVPSARTALEAIKRYRELAKKLLPSIKGQNTAQALATVQANRVKLNIRKNAGDPDVKDFVALGSTVPTQVKAFGDTGNIAIKESEFALQALPGFDDSLESALTKLDSREDLLKTVVRNSLSSSRGQSRAPAGPPKIIGPITIEK